MPPELPGPGSGSVHSRSRLLVPIGPIQRTELKAQIEQLRTSGATPLAFALEQAREDCAKISGSKLLILVSDGMETCRGDPIAAARDLVSSGFNLRVHVVGYDVAQYQAAREQLKQIADVAGGTYFDASDSEELRSALRIAAPIRYTVYNEQGENVFMGLLGETGPRLPAGLYRVFIETSPPLELVDVSVQSNQTTTIRLRRSDGEYETEVE